MFRAPPPEVSGERDSIVIRAGRSTDTGGLGAASSFLETEPNQRSKRLLSG